MLPADAIAVYAITASAPISMASAAWLGRPMPASMITGTLEFLMITSMKSRARRPLFEPIIAPSGITQAAPASSRRFAAIGSGNMYGMTTKPSFASFSVALMVSSLSGSRYFDSCSISTFTKSVWHTSRARRAIRTASSALRAPDVFGSMVMPFGM